MNTLDLKHAKTKTYAVRGYNVDITFVYDERHIYVVQGSIINQMPDHTVAKNKFKHIQTGESVTIKKGDVRSNKYLTAMFSGARQNQARVNTINDTVTVLKRFDLPLANKIIETIEQRQANIKKLQNKLFGSKYGLDFQKIVDSTHERTKEIKPMIIDATKVKKLAKGKKSDYKALEAKYNSLKQVFEDKLKDYEKLSVKHSKLKESYDQVDVENARLFKKLGQAETDMKAYDDLKVKYDSLKRHFEDLDSLYHENYNDLVKVRNANFGKRLAAVFTGWGV